MVSSGIKIRGHCKQNASEKFSGKNYLDYLALHAKFTIGYINYNFIYLFFEQSTSENQKNGNHFKMKGKKKEDALCIA